MIKPLSFLLLAALASSPSRLWAGDNDAGEYTGEADVSLGTKLQKPKVVVDPGKKGENSDDAYQPQTPLTVTSPQELPAVPVRAQSGQAGAQNADAVLQAAAVPLGQQQAASSARGDVISGRPDPDAQAAPARQAAQYTAPVQADVQNRVVNITHAIDTGDKQQAAALIQDAAKQYPDDPHIQALAQLAVDKDIKADQPKLAQKIKALLFNRDAGAVADAAQPQAQLASPIGALLAAASPARAPQPPASLPEGTPLQLRQSLPKQTLLAMQIGDYGQAENNLTQTIKSDPGNWMAWRLRGLTRYYRDNLPGADADASTALTINPKDSPSHWIKALVRLKENKPEAAKREADASLALNPRNADAFVTRAQAFEKLGQNDAALADYRQAAELDSALASYYHQALAERGRGAQMQGLSRARALYLAAAGLALLFLGLSFFVKRGQTAVRQAAGAPMRADDRHPALGGFRILRRLGQGGMGVVFEAVDEALERRVALKRMRDEIAGDPRERRRFIKEARTVAALHHPSIVEIYSIVEQDQALYLVFEFLKGRPLDALLEERGGKLSSSETLPLAREVAAALDYAHASGVIHQDLKPGNINVDGGKAKVMDFGIARRVQETLSTVSRMEVAGTPAYMAPEQERGVVSPAADIYALGACLYQLMGGRLPFPAGGSYLDKAQRRYVPLSTLAGLPASVDRVIDRALDPDPAKRPATAGDLVAALEAALALPKA